jgi:RND family efflux transporter MFP subunit
MKNNINIHFKKIYFLTKAILVQLKQWFLELQKVYQILTFVLLLSLIFLIYKFTGDKKIEENIVQKDRLVTISNVAQLSDKNSAIPLVGIVTSVNEATILTEAGGRLTRVYKKLGDRVFAGQVIGEIENSGERAAVLQAEGGYDAARAGRDISTISNSTSGNNLDSAKSNALNTLSNAYVTMDDIVRGKTDAYFSNPKELNIKLNILFPNQIQTGKIQSLRLKLEKVLKDRENKNKSLTINNDLESELDVVSNELTEVRYYLDDLANAFGNSLPDDSFTQESLNLQKTIVGGLRSQIIGVISSVTGAKQSLITAKAGNQISSGNKNPTSASSDAQVKIALGSYNSALSRLSKTIIRSPITGTLNSISIQTGDFVNPSQQVAIVSNNGALEILAYISENDVNRISTGVNVLINSNIKGVISKIASALDPFTRKIEVRIAIMNQNSNLINGQSVRISVADTPNKVLKANEIKIIKVPLSAVKITPRGSYVFTVDESLATKTLKSITVETGSLLGEEVQINSGLKLEDNIVIDVRGIKENQKVEVK